MSKSLKNFITIRQALDSEVEGSGQKTSASGSYLDLGRAPYALYGVKYIDLVSL